MTEQEAYKLNPKFPMLAVPPLRKVGDRVMATPEEDFVNTYLRKSSDSATPKFLREIYWLLQNPQIYNRVICVAPRGFAKSTVVCVNDTLYDIYVRSNKKLCEALGCPGQYRYYPSIILITASKPLAVKWISKIKAHIVTNEKLVGRFGNIGTDGDREGIWQQDHIKVCSSSGPIEIIAYGRESAIRGERSAKVKVDDILKDEEATSDTSGDKIEYWMKSAVEGMFDDLDAVLFWIGTILRPEDVVDNCYEKRGWSDDWFRAKYRARDNFGKSIWPSKFSDEFLNFKERNMGPVAFAAEYMSEPILMKDAIFSRAWFQKKYKDAELPPRLEKILSVDPAASDGKASDYSHLDVLGYCNDGEHKMDIFVLDSHNDKLDPDSLTKKICDLYVFWNCTKLVLETQVAQVYLRENVLREARDRGLWINIEEIKHPPLLNRKIEHAKSTIFLHKQGKVYWREGDDKQEELISQFCNFPLVKNDDGVDSVTMNLRSKIEYYQSLENRDFENIPKNEELACPELGW